MVIVPRTDAAVTDQPEAAPPADSAASENFNSRAMPGPELSH